MKNKAPEGFAVRTGPNAPRAVGRPRILARPIVQAVAKRRAAIAPPVTAMPVTAMPVTAMPVMKKGGKVKC